MGEKSDEGLKMGNLIEDLGERRRSDSGSSGYSSHRLERSPSEGSSASGISEVARMPMTKQINITKNELDYKNQTFAERPGTIVDLNPASKCNITTNFVKLIKSEEAIVLHHYIVTIKDSRSTMTKRPRITNNQTLMDCITQNRKLFPENLKKLVYNENMLWSQEQLDIPLQRIKLPVKDSDGQEVATVEIQYSSILELSKNVQLAPKEDLTLSIGNSTVREGNATADLSNDSQEEFSTNFCYDKICLKIELNEKMTGNSGNFTIKLIVPERPMMDIELFRSVSHAPKISLISFILNFISDGKLTPEKYDDEVKNLQSCGMSDSNRRKLSDLLNNVPVQLNYGRRRAFRFTGLSDQPASKLFFSDGKERISVAKHFQDNSHPLQFPNLPCVIGPNFNGMADRPAFPLEVIQILADTQKFNGRIAETQLSSLFQEKERSLFDLLKIKKNLAIEGENKSGAEEVPALFGKGILKQPVDSTLKKHLVNVDAIILEHPTRINGNKHGVGEDVDDESKLTVENKKTNKIKKIVPSIITIENPHSSSPMSCNYEHCIPLLEVLEQFGQPVLRRSSSPTKQPKPCLYSVGSHDQRENNINDLREKLKEIKERMANDEDLTNDETQAVPLIIFVFADRCTAYDSYINVKQQKTSIDVISDYGIIKQLCDGELGMNCQGILQKTFNSINKTTDSIAHNIAFKILAKVGTVHYMLERDGTHENWNTLTSENEATLVLGINVAHRDFYDKIKELDSKTDIVSKCSIAAVVGNIDYEMSKFGESVLVKRKGENNLSFGIEEAIKERIDKYEENCGVKPKHIVCYREGVSETEFKRVVHDDKMAIIKACEMIGENCKPTITYIIVSKERHTRFCGNEDIEGNICNVKPGTLVETGITSRDFFDFYLASHSDDLVTSRPTHYYVLHDDWKPNVSFWQTITYALTYAYVPTTKSIRKPAPVVYAQLCAKRSKDRIQAIDQMKRQAGETFNPNDDNEYKKLTDQVKPHQDLDGMLYC